MGNDLHVVLGASGSIGRVVVDEFKKEKSKDSCCSEKQSSGRD
jgi:hypothetical protein